MVQRVMERFEGEPIDAFIVWLPVIRGDYYEETHYARTMVRDARAHHYWDSEGKLGEIFSPILGLRATMAWDVYIVFDKDASRLDRPAGWMHQLVGEDRDRELTEPGLERLLRDASTD
jgi:hypothetical protein